jgi:hypothetical protein
MAGAASLALAAGAQAAISDPVIHIHASNAQGAGNFDVPLAAGMFNGDGSYFYFLPAPVDIISGGNTIATITQMNTFIRPASAGLPNLISFGFAVQAGGGGVTSFTMDATVLPAGFVIGPALSMARTSAGIGVTDTNGDGVHFLGTEAGGGAYLTQYNHGTNFASIIVGPVGTNSPNGSDSRSDSNPGGGLYTPIGNATNMNAEWAYTLTANDTAAGTSAWEILPVPAPGAISLIGLGGLIAIRRSRR